MNEKMKGMGPNDGRGPLGQGPGPNMGPNGPDDMMRNKDKTKTGKKETGPKEMRQEGDMVMDDLQMEDNTEDILAMMDFKEAYKLLKDNLVDVDFYNG
jgi:hypothetical protein